jgi:phosphorylcholine metabolism protein LicD
MYIVFFILSFLAILFYFAWRYFHTCSNNHHLDNRFIEDCHIKYTPQMYFLTCTKLLDALQSMAVDVKFTLMYGGLIGYHMNGELLPFDDDLDLVVIGDDDVKKLLKYHGWETDDYIFEVHPWHNSRNFIQKIYTYCTDNFIDARMICKRTSMFIDLTFLYQDKSKKSYRARDFNAYASSDLLPLREVVFHNRHIFIPYKVENVLIKRYGKVLVFKNYTLIDGEWKKTDENSIHHLQMSNERLSFGKKY